MVDGVATLIRRTLEEGGRFELGDEGQIVVRDMAALPQSLCEQIRAEKDEIRCHLTGADVGPSSQLLRLQGIDVLYLGDHREARDAVRQIVAEAERLGPDERVGIDIETAPRDEFYQLSTRITLERSGRPRRKSPVDEAGLDPNRADIRLAQFYPGGGIAYVFDLHVVPFEVLQPLHNLRLVAHNAVFETAFLLGARIAPRSLPIIDCTMLAANILFGVFSSLADLAQNQLHMSVDKTQQTSDWRAPNLSDEQVAYAAQDAVVTYLLWQELLPRLGSRKPAYQAMADAQPSVAWLRNRGIGLDGEALDELQESWAAERDVAAETVAELLPGLNPKSSPQVAYWLHETLTARERAAWPRTGTGQLSTSSTDLASLGDNPAAAALIRIRKLDKLLSTYAASLVDHVNPATGRVHADYRIGGAKTGRFTCSGPNIQNQPTGRDGGPTLRPVWAAPEGRVLVGGDWSQMELRAAAIIADDFTMKTAFRQGQDLHRLTAARVSGMQLEDISKDGPERQLAKALNFGLLYGMGAKRFRQYAADDYGVTMTDAEAKRYLNAFFRTYSGIRSWQRQQANISKLRGYAETRLGRRVECNRGGEFSYTLALNTPVQGSCAEVLLIALARLPEALAGLDAFPVAIIHDEIILEAAEADAGPAASALEAIMTDAFCAVFPESPRNGLVEVKTGHSWADLK